MRRLVVSNNLAMAEKAEWGLEEFLEVKAIMGA